MRFRTQEQVDRLRLSPGGKDQWHFDQETTGLTVRIQGARRTWVVWYSAGGKRRRIKIGDVAAVRLREARIEATRIVQSARGGEDALAQLAVKREAAKAKAADTLARLIAVYLERRAKPQQRPRTYVETERYLLRYWEPLHARPVDAITRRDVAAEVERIRVEHGPTAAGHARAYLSGCYAWAMRQGFAESNPTIGTEAPAIPTTPARKLRPSELAEIWRACEDDDFGIIVRLLTLSGQRRQEVAAMAWPELDVDRKLWTIPGARTKNHREHEVPLSDQALSLLPERRPERDLLFGHRAGPFSGFSQAKARLDAKLGLRPWRLHDLRHSFVTHANEIGIDPHIIEAAVNHQSGFRGGIAGRYNAAQYREPKRAAMQRYADWLMTVVSGEQPASNVRAFG